MENFAICRGLVVTYQSGGSGGGFFELSPGLTGSPDNPILINGIEGSDNDLVSPVVTLNRSKILYNFGEDFGQIGISGTILLGQAGKPGDAFQQVLSYFKQHRTSTSSSTISVSAPGGDAFKLFLVGLSFSVPDQEFHIQRFTLNGLIASPSS